MPATRDHLTPHRHGGDGWVECSYSPDGAGAPHRHWGLLGAAGLLLVRRAGDGAVSDVVLQHRALWSHHGGTWGVPGGALDVGEDAVTGALRESWEEAGVEPRAVRVVGAHVLDHGVWRYTTVVGEVADGAAVHPEASDPESLQVRWVPVGELGALPLLPAFAAALPALWDVLAAGGSGSEAAGQTPGPRA
ncbi:NUDIX domain-containing protein [Xylanimonas ulmi]|uniref:ADP-ribose pyrophosphatase YjhB (NUDIX family) n=1 Tax=Xylanimonas ulmi TaxID=228973 RepID=A0A4Q7M6L5_9MICO|nr:NUDIX hydrolase [Xylanibacterium ulmi]RZS61719.1 ADP-ribose pyrophosphatase YjhB (NUDIX family) [Xylanibacterium ulmi]